MKEQNYAAAFEELQQIVGEMEMGNISIDDLAIKVKRAAELIHLCKSKLKATELDVQKILDELDETADNNWVIFLPL